MPKRGSF